MPNLGLVHTSKPTQERVLRYDGKAVFVPSIFALMYALLMQTHLVSSIDWVNFVFALMTTLFTGTATNNFFSEYVWSFYLTRKELEEQHRRKAQQQRANTMPQSQPARRTQPFDGSLVSGITGRNTSEANHGGLSSHSASSHQMDDNTVPIRRVSGYSDLNYVYVLEFVFCWVGVVMGLRTFKFILSEFTPVHHNYPWLVGWSMVFSLLVMLIFYIAAKCPLVLRKLVRVLVQRVAHNRKESAGRRKVGNKAQRAFPRQSSGSRRSK